MTTPHIDQLRNHLMETLAALRDREHPMEPDRARAVAQVASVLVDTAKVSGPGLPDGITAITRHRMQG